MTSQSFSRDIWDYLDGMPYMPSRQDRDKLLESAHKDPRGDKRVRLWDYFFRIELEDLGVPQKIEIESLQLKAQLNEKNLRAAVRKVQSRATKTGGLALLALILFQWPTIRVAAAVILSISVVVIVVYESNLRKQLNLMETNLENQIALLEKSIEGLARRLPNPPDDTQVHNWLQEDIEYLRQLAIERTGLESRLIDLKDVPNPMCILGPAELQGCEQIPAPFLNGTDDRRKHLKARRLAALPNEQFQDFYGVYQVEFILVASDMLGNYGCFFDFVTGKIHGEHTWEQYYHDVVALTTNHEYRKIEIGPSVVVVENAPTFKMSLTSGDHIKVTFASREYFDGIRRQDKNAPKSFDPERMAINPGTAADNAIKALRSRLRKHKGLKEDA